VLLALNYMHETKQITHRDMKLENILCMPNGNDPKDFTVKLTDFGFAAHFEEGEDFSLTLGSPMYMSPEIVLREDYDRRCDVWAVGVIVYILVSGYPPFYAEKRGDLDEAIVNQECDFDDEIFEKVSPDCIDFIKKCLEKRQEDRPFVSELL